MRRPRVKLDNLVAIIAVAEERDIDMAADEMGLTPSAVRKQIEAVEAVLGVRLFEGKKGHIIPTEDGEVFLSDARKSVEHALLAEEKTSSRQVLKNHHLRIGHSTYLPPKLIALIHQMGIDNRPLLRIHHVSGLTSTVVKRVLEGSLHTGVGFLPIESPDLLVRTVHEEPVVVCLPSDHRLAVKPTIFPADLDGEPIVTVAREQLPHLHREIEEHFRDFGIELCSIADAFAPPEALAYVAQGVGICLLARTSVDHRPGITVRTLSTRVLTRRVGVFLRADSDSAILVSLINTLIQKTATNRRNA